MQNGSTLAIYEAASLVTSLSIEQTIPPQAFRIGVKMQELETRCTYSLASNGIKRNPTLARYRQEGL